jgi:predicted nucleotidyltransferase
LARYERGVTLPTVPTLERLLLACGERLEIRSSRSSLAAPLTSIRGQIGARAKTLRRHRRQLLEAARSHGVARVHVFGSTARGEEEPGSDVDLLVELAAGKTLLDLVAFQRDAESILGLPVDVATADMLKDRIRATVLKEALPL